MPNLSSVPSILITGTSTGLGHALARHYLAEGFTVYGLSRSGSNIQHPSYHDAQLDLSDLGVIQAALSKLLAKVSRLELIILNAGVLGDIEPMSAISMEKLKLLMDINVWSNKLLLDHLYREGLEIEQVMAVSSGAAINGNKGWGAYSLSKAALNMLIKLYAAETENTHFVALAPGLIDTRMQDHLCDQTKVDQSEFPSVMKLRAARGTAAMPTPELAAANIAKVLPRLKTELESGEFIDMRSL